LTRKRDGERGDARKSEEDELLRQTMAGVRPLPAKPARVPLRAEDRVAHLRPPGTDELSPEFVIHDDGIVLEGRRIDLAPRLLARLRRGEMAVEATLDLHGHRSAEAKKAVAAFVEGAYASGVRGLLIIHGRGSHSPAGRAVLRDEVADWLTRGRLARRVLCFATAPRAEGGRGALSVLLQRGPPQALP
jgi:DNA-nicking Smr family endonuclease